MTTLVRIKGTVITAAYGALADGTLLRTSPEFAKHLVDDARAAEYVTAQAPQATASEPAATTAPATPEVAPVKSQRKPK